MRLNRKQFLKATSGIAPARVVGSLSALCFSEPVCIGTGPYHSYVAAQSDKPNSTYERTV